ncbi:sterol desaturase family protein [Flavobacteriales bacterium]|nr:sterol desaturase family protein [Flavobacteriales bacterium]
MEWQVYLDKFIASGSKNLIRYALFAGIPYILFYVLFQSKTFRMKIQQKVPKTKDIKREVLYSLSSIVVFSIISMVTLHMIKTGRSAMYMDVSDYGQLYFWLSIPLLIVLHDAYFYWTHRAMHWKPVFKHVHLVHHKSTDPTPWAAFSFHPLEAIIQGGYFPLIVLVLPVHPVAVLVWVLYQFTLNVLGHLGYEILPKGFTKSKLTFWHNTGTHHNMHHKYFSCNYGLYFNVWDRLMGTNHAKYDETFEEVCARRAGTSEPVVSQSHS